MRIKEIIRAKGYTQKEFADKLGITLSALNQRLDGNPTVGSLREIADALEVDLLDLFEDTRRNEPKQKYICPHCKQPINIEIKQ
ncbi:MAG: helix-turn-helix transcriptional regulator [Proteiniphilum sp.]|nr:helix-turn-helix transcriptional regulator [Proteiniphilum sp.]MDD4800285.1 helix-turn-helix transcriptional regulator [Proteiniphilum sp.]